MIKFTLVHTWRTQRALPVSQSWEARYFFLLPSPRKRLSSHEGETSCNDARRRVLFFLPLSLGCTLSRVQLCALCTFLASMDFSRSRHLVGYLRSRSHVALERAEPRSRGPLARRKIRHHDLKRRYVRGWRLMANGSRTADSATWQRKTTGHRFIAVESSRKLRGPAAMKSETIE